jgi:hypothetical protein
VNPMNGEMRGLQVRPSVGSSGKIKPHPIGGRECAGKC